MHDCKIRPGGRGVAMHLAVLGPLAALGANEVGDSAFTKFWRDPVLRSTDGESRWMESWTLGMLPDGSPVGR